MVIINMVKDIDFKEINEAYIELIHKNLHWIYMILSDTDINAMETTLVKLNQQMLTTLATVITQRQLHEESNTLTNMIDMFKISKN